MKYTRRLLLVICFPATIALILLLFLFSRSEEEFHRDMKGLFWIK